MQNLIKRFSNLEKMRKVKDIRPYFFGVISMGKIAILTFITLDGVMQSPSGPDEDPSDGFKHGGWAQDWWSEAMAQVREHAMNEPYDIMFGRTTYDMFAEHFPETDTPLEVKRINEATKYVVTSRPETLNWKNSHPIDGASLVSEVVKLKQNSENLLQIHGSWSLIQQLIDHDLVDEYRLWIFPVIVGNGKKLFGSTFNSKPLSLIKSDTTENGVTMSFYKRYNQN